MEAKGEVVRRGFAGGVKVADLIVATADEVVITDDHARNGGEKDRIGGKVGCEVVGGRKEVPSMIFREADDGNGGMKTHHGHIARPTMAQM